MKPSTCSSLVIFRPKAASDASMAVAGSAFAVAPDDLYEQPTALIGKVLDNK